MIKEWKLSTYKQNCLVTIYLPIENRIQDRELKFIQFHVLSYKSLIALQCIKNLIFMNFNNFS